MAKLYFKYGAMGCSKTAQALITKFNYEERGMKVLLMKPAIDDREEKAVVRSRIGLEAPCIMVPDDMDLYRLYEKNYADCDVVIVDECQFLTEKQVDELGDLVLEKNIPVLCFGLRTDFLTHLFPGSKRLLEIAESVTEIKSVCRCGAKATVNARFDDQGNVVYKGAQVLIGGNSRYEAMCRRCWLKRKKEQEEKGIVS
ncbi:MAG: thymidine kinase [Lachnospiraceae bacterium]|nr:thymidine kinase [Lachnospiraceae bacterium]